MKEENDLLNELLVSADNYYRSENYEQAITHYKKVIDINPKNSYIYIKLANALAQIKRYDEAINLLS